MDFNTKNTPSILAIIFVIFSFLILIGASSGLFSSPESLQTQTIQGIFGLLMLIAGYYYGTIHKNNDNTQTSNSKMKQVFWDLTVLTDEVLEINGISITPTPAQDLKNINSAFSVVPDNTDVHVLTADFPSTVILKLNGASGIYLSTSVSADFASGRPTRPGTK